VERHVGNFEAIDPTGGRHTIQLHEEEAAVGTFPCPPAWVSYLTRLRTEDGRPVHYLSRGHYLLPDGVALTSDDPDAP
jgi:hypothetical protein